MQGVSEEWFYSQSSGFIYVSPPNTEAVKSQNALLLRVWNGVKHWKLIVVNLWMKGGATADSQQPSAALQQPLSLMKRKRSAQGAQVDLSSQHFNGPCLHLIRPPDGRAPRPLPPPHCLFWPEQQQDAVRAAARDNNGGRRQWRMQPPFSANDPINKGRELKINIRRLRRHRPAPPANPLTYVRGREGGGSGTGCDKRRSVREK